MEEIAGLMREFGIGGNRKGKRRASDNAVVGTAGKYIFTAIIVPWIFSRVVRPLRSSARIFLAKQMKRGMRQSGKRSTRVMVCGALLKNLDFFTRKETLFAFWFAFLVLMRTVMPQFKGAMRTIMSSRRRR
ncbi:hypothetical protein Dda_1156 [Drechslerella dactyloides]|uniref:Uncharacterized protein n=1 Tax=Drechslerella dactyloides TaxID=74499 RepID=A0AAD6NMR4_DREDA|nr:hypothetical protein Dda_1156 [Drechslerella dactyloides]